MALFFVIAALLVVVTLALLLPVLTKREESTVAVSRTDTNVSIAKAQMLEFKNRLNDGEISSAEYDAEIARIEAGLARDIEPEAQASHLGGEANYVNSQGKSKGQWIMFPLAALFPIAAGLLYMSLGTPAAIDPANTAPAPVASQQAAPDMQEVIAQIKQRLAQQPEDARGWFMLGISQLRTGEYQEAEAALRKSLEVDGTNVEVKVRLAEAIAINQDGSLLGEPAEVLRSALDSSPDNPRGLWLYGIASSEAGNPETAMAVWNKLLPQLSSDPQSAKEIELLIAGAKQQIADANGTQAGATENSANSNGSIQVEVSVKEGLAAGLDANTSVFVYAKAVKGPPMPLAVVKLSLGELPLSVTLSDAQAMMEAMKISAFSEVVVGARISKTGNPIAQSGDLFTEISGVVTADPEPVKIEISNILK